MRKLPLLLWSFMSTIVILKATVVHSRCGKFFCPDHCEISYLNGCPHNCNCKKQVIRCPKVTCPAKAPICLVYTQLDGCQECACQRPFIATEDTGPPKSIDYLFLNEGETSDELKDNSVTVLSAEGEAKVSEISPRAHLGNSTGTKDPNQVKHRDLPSTKLPPQTSQGKSSSEAITSTQRPEAEIIFVPHEKTSNEGPLTIAHWPRDGPIGLETGKTLPIKDQTLRNNGALNEEILSEETLTEALIEDVVSTMDERISTTTAPLQSTKNRVTQWKPTEKPVTRQLATTRQVTTITPALSTWRATKRPPLHTILQFTRHIVHTTTPQTITRRPATVHIQDPHRVLRTFSTKPPQTTTTKTPVAQTDTASFSTWTQRTYSTRRPIPHTTPHMDSDEWILVTDLPESSTELPTLVFATRPPNRFSTREPELISETDSGTKWINPTTTNIPTTPRSLIMNERSNDASRQASGQNEDLLGSSSRASGNRGGRLTTSSPIRQQNRPALNHSEESEDANLNMWMNRHIEQEPTSGPQAVVDFFSGPGEPIVGGNTLSHPSEVKPEVPAEIAAWAARIIANDQWGRSPVAVSRPGPSVRTRSRSIAGFESGLSNGRNNRGDVTGLSVQSNQRSRSSPWSRIAARVDPRRTLPSQGRCGRAPTLHPQPVNGNNMAV